MVGYMDEGLYESLMTSGLASRLLALEGAEPELSRVDPADQVHTLSRYIAHAIGHRLGAERDPDRRLEVANGILDFLDASNEVTAPVQELLAIRRPPGPGQIVRFAQRPKTPLNRRRSSNQCPRRAKPRERTQG